MKDGSQLTLQNLIHPTYPLTIHRPILITDSAQSIGMKIPKGKTTSTTTTTTSSTTSTTTTTTNTITNPITIREIGKMIGMDHPVSVMDVQTQDEMEGWNLRDLVEYFEDEDRLYQLHQEKNTSNTSSNTSSSRLTTRQKNTTKTHQQQRQQNNSSSNNSNANYFHSKPRVLNQISLEFSNTLLRKYTLSPTFVRDIDWIDNVWPTNKRYDSDGNDTYPRVQYYCLTSTAGCYTDFHIDFGGTSVWYHVLSGKKVFLLIPPTKTNLQLYESWLCRKDQADIFFPDMKDIDENSTVMEVKSCVRVTLEQNQTLIIPTGWIHAVYTPVDSIVIGGNFLHGLNIKGQLDIHCVETRTRVPAKFRFPYFVQIMFYAGKQYLERMLKPDGVIFPEELDGMDTLVSALTSWAVKPDGDANRVGSVAHVICECINDLAIYGVTDVDSMLKLLSSEAKRIKAGQLKNNYNELQTPPKKTPLKSPILKLSLKRPTPKTALAPAIESPRPNDYKTTVKPKRLKIGDLSSKNALIEDEWLPEVSKTKSRKISPQKSKAEETKKQKNVGKLHAKQKRNALGSRSRLRKKLGF